MNINELDFENIGSWPLGARLGAIFIVFAIVLGGGFYYFTQDKLAELEKSAENLAHEIERTRRRVSALENTRIPNLEDTIRFITGQLEERARDAVVSTMRVKAMILAKEDGK